MTVRIAKPLKEKRFLKNGTFFISSDNTNVLKSAETNGILLRRSTNCPWLLGLEFGLLPTLLGKGTMSVACNNLTFNALAKSYFQIVQNAECLGLRNKVQHSRHLATGLC